jgi:hypothetical protein
MNEDDIRKGAFPRPLTGPTFAPGSYRFVQREYLIITYPRRHQRGSGQPSMTKRKRLCSSQGSRPTHSPGNRSS